MISQTEWNLCMNLWGSFLPGGAVGVQPIIFQNLTAGKQNYLILEGKKTAFLDSTPERRNLHREAQYSQKY